MRAKIPWQAAWGAVRSKDTLAHYQRFVEMWPSHYALAEDRIRELKHPVLRRVTSGVFWFAWGVLAVGAAAVVLIVPLVDRFAR
ncbi:hypothetical protein BRAS3809_6860027 [Bradyrhizobium sp. STM 3809]|nr:hypothetical protein BRAS3809_6860027 [Bradyrhizobium sp. STM 3809]